MELLELLDREWIVPRLAAENKTDAIRQLVAVLAEHGALEEPELALQAVLEREGVRTTGIGQGIALPHGKYPRGHKPVIAIGLAPGGVDFDSVDGKPADIIVLMVSPSDQVARHIQVLARISRYLSFDSFRRDLRKAATADEIYEVVMRKEQQSAAAD
jgi:mannitol/fructose-specific phosphotransferase system IIA component (Ntr-type)